MANGHAVNHVLLGPLCHQEYYAQLCLLLISDITIFQENYVHTDIFTKQIFLYLSIVLQTNSCLHIIASNDVESKDDLLNTLARTEHTFVALV